MIAADESTIFTAYVKPNPLWSVLVKFISATYKRMPLAETRAKDLVGRMGHATIAVLGDLMLDEYLIGTVERISPEAPVPVVDIQTTSIRLGGAANVAANIHALRDSVVLIGLIGSDESGQRLQALVAEQGMSPDSILVDRNRRTTVKTRVIANSQQVVRADREDRIPCTPQQASMVIEQLEENEAKLRALIISDYGKGMITKELLAEVIPWCRKRRIFVAVDPKDANFFNYQFASLVTPNHHEAGFAAGRKIRTEEDLIAVGQQLRERLNADAVLITRGPQGMSLFDASGITHIPTFARHVFDVTGAGDTVIASFVAAMAADATLVEAAVISNAAAGFTVGEVGTASITLSQLEHELHHQLDLSTLPEVVRVQPA